MQTLTLDSIPRVIVIWQPYKTAVALICETLTTHTTHTSSCRDYSIAIFYRGSPPIRIASSDIILAGKPASSSAFEYEAGDGQPSKLILISAHGGGGGGGE